MKPFARLLIVGLVLAASGALAQDTPPRLIVRGDDMGYAHAGNQAILKCSKEGIQTSVEIIVPSPWFPEAVRMLNDHPDIDVGIHLSLTSEWDNIKWRPVSHAPSLCDPEGYLFPMVFPNRNYPGRSLAENPWKIEEVEREIRAQIELALRKIPRISHLSAHMGCSALSGEVRALVKRLAKEYKIDIDPSELGVTGVTYRGPRGSSAEKIESFLNMLDTLEPGKTYLFVDHPGLDTPELRAIHHIGYENVAVDRQGVTDTWTHPRIRDRIRTRGIQLISYEDLKR